MQYNKIAGGFASFPPPMIQGLSSAQQPQMVAPVAPGGAAPANALGFLVLGFVPSAGVPTYGITVYLDPSSPLITLGTFSDANGIGRVGLSLAGVPAGLPFHTQYVWLNPASCGSSQLVSSSDALQVTVQ